MGETHRGIPALQVTDRKEWRRWLKKNHSSEKAVWLILFKKGVDTQSIKYDEAVEEALCFGWIDSVVYKRDENSRYQYYCPRKTTSVWSSSNRDRVKKMTELGLMEESGQRHVDLAKKNGAWEAMIAVEKLILPEDLKKYLEKNKKATKNFEAFPPSSKRIILVWILAAKREETRQSRIEKTVTMASQNLRANH